MHKHCPARQGEHCQEHCEIGCKEMQRLYHPAPVINVYETNVVIIEEEEHRHKHHHTKLVLSGLKYKTFTIKKSIIMAISLNANEFVTSTLGLVDHATQVPITSASFSNQSYVSDQPGIASVDALGKVTAVSAGTANITFTADVSYTGTDGQPKTETGKTLVVAVTVTGSAQSTDLTVTFSAPQPVV